MYIKVKYLKDGVESKRAYTFESDIPVKIGDTVSIGKAVAVVTGVNIQEDEVASYKDKIKKIDGKVKNEK